MADAFAVVREFERAVAEYTGAPYVVAVNSCSMALLLAVAYVTRGNPCAVEIPRRTYVSVPMSIRLAGCTPRFRDEDWCGVYELRPLVVYDAARWFTSGMFNSSPVLDGRLQGDERMNQRRYVCVSFHHSKTLGDTQGGAILHNDPEADRWLRRARFDGRTEGVAPHEDTFDQLGWHAYMSPDVAVRLLWRLPKLPRHNAPLPNDEYPDLSLAPVFR